MLVVDGIETSGGASGRREGRKDITWCWARQGGGDAGECEEEDEGLHFCMGWLQMEQMPWLGGSDDLWCNYCWKRRLKKSQVGQFYSWSGFELSGTVSS